METQVKLQDALAQDALPLLLHGGRFLSADDIASRIAPRRRREVGLALNELAERGIVDTNRGGGRWPTVYGRKAITRR